MKKGVIIGIALLTGIASLTSCNRRHDCTCTHSGDLNARYEREYRGYSRDEATKLCKSEEQASNAARKIQCELR